MNDTRSTRHGFSRHELEDIAHGLNPSAIDDMEFLETLSYMGCFLMSPWVYHFNEQQELEPLTPIQYRDDYSLDKAGILLAVMDRMVHQQTQDSLAV